MVFAFNCPALLFVQMASFRLKILLHCTLFVKVRDESAEVIKGSHAERTFFADINI